MSSLRFLEPLPSKVPPIIGPSYIYMVCWLNKPSLVHVSRKITILLAGKDGGNNSGAVLLSLGHLWRLPHLSWGVGLISPSLGSENNSMGPSWCLWCFSQDFLLCLLTLVLLCPFVFGNLTFIVCLYPRKSHWCLYILMRLCAFRI